MRTEAQGVVTRSMSKPRPGAIAKTKRTAVATASGPTKKRKRSAEKEIEFSLKDDRDSGYTLYPMLDVPSHVRKLCNPNDVVLEEGEYVVCRGIFVQCDKSISFLTTQCTAKATPQRWLGNRFIHSIHRRGKLQAKRPCEIHLRCVSNARHVFNVCAHLCVLLIATLVQLPPGTNRTSKMNATFQTDFL